MMEEEKAIAKQLEMGLGSKGRLKILRAMAKRPNEFFTRYSLQRLTGLNTMGLKADLGVLMELGWIRAYPGNPVKYKIEVSNPFVREIVEFFRRVGYA